MDNMNLFNERKKAKDKIEFSDVVDIAKVASETVTKIASPVTLEVSTREGRATKFLNSISADFRYKQPLEFLEQAFDLEQLFLLQSCISLKKHKASFTLLDSFNGYKERELNFNARQKLEPLASDIVFKLWDSVRRFEKATECYSTDDLEKDIYLVSSYKFVRYYVDCSQNSKVGIKMAGAGKYVVENVNGTAKVNANFTLELPHFFEYICKLNEKCKSFRDTKL